MHDVIVIEIIWERDTDAHSWQMGMDGREGEDSHLYKQQAFSTPAKEVKVQTKCIQLYQD